VDETTWREALAFFEGTPEPGEQVDPEMVSAVQEAFRNRTGSQLEKVFANRTPEQVVAEHRAFMVDLHLQSGIDVLRAELAASRQREPSDDDETTLRRFIDDEMRKEMLRQLEYKRARRLAPLVRQAGQAVPNSVPLVSPDTVWSGDLGTLVELCEISARRVNRIKAAVHA
jgi:hypothetical protein